MGWKREDPRSQEKTRRDREGTRVVTSEGSGKIHAEYKVPTFSQMVPYSHQIAVKYPDTKVKHHPAKEVRILKEHELPYWTGKK